MTQRKLSTTDVQPVYSDLPVKHRAARERLGRPLTLAEKILFGHLVEFEGDVQVPVRGSTYAFLKPDRVAMQDATAQMAMLQFMQVGMDEVQVPTTVHCDHLILARNGAREDLDEALRANNEVYDALRSMSTKYNIGFWKPGAGIIHQVVLEQYAFPGALMLGTDSHTPNAGGLGMLAIGVGGADAVFTMAGEAWGVRWPKLIGVKLTGSLSGWASPKDVILKLAGILSVKGGTGAIVEYFGPGARTISATGKATICNMGAELGATTSVFPVDNHMLEYLRYTDRSGVASLADMYSRQLTADPEVEANPEKYYDQVIEIDLDTLEPHIVGPHTPDLARPISELKAAVEAEGYPADLRYALIGSCTNSSYEDMSRAAFVANQAGKRDMKARIGFLVTPGSEQIRLTIERDGQMAQFESIDGKVLANACGPCIGQWKRSDITDGEQNSIITSFNRNFRRRNDGNASTLSFIASPEIVTAFALSGDLRFNPLVDELVAPDGTQFKLTPPPQAGLPEDGFQSTDFGYIAPPASAAERSQVSVSFAPDSERLEVLTPFAAWDGEDLTGLRVLMKAEGKCTTDHISPAGMWLRFRGHLDKISDNMFFGANNAFAEKAGQGYNVLDGSTGSLSQIARLYKAKNIDWIAVGDENYGEGSSREHAAMSPRHLGCRAVIVRSFARIHETNLKQQGVLALTFDSPEDYHLIGKDDQVSILGLNELAPGKPVLVKIVHSDGTSDEILTNHTMTEKQIEWFKAGSNLNYIGSRADGEAGESTETTDGCCESGGTCSIDGTTCDCSADSASGTCQRHQGEREKPKRFSLIQWFLDWLDSWK